MNKHILLGQAMEENENEWGHSKEEFYADEKDANNSSAEEDEYNEIMKMQQIRAHKLKLAESNKLKEGDGISVFLYIFTSGCTRCAN